MQSGYKIFSFEPMKHKGFWEFIHVLPKKKINLTISWLMRINHNISCNLKTYLTSVFQNKLSSKKKWNYTFLSLLLCVSLDSSASSHALTLFIKLKPLHLHCNIFIAGVVLLFLFTRWSLDVYLLEQQSLFSCCWPPLGVEGRKEAGLWRGVVASKDLEGRNSPHTKWISFLYLKSKRKKRGI